MEGLNKETRCRGTRRQLEERVQWTLKGTGRLSAHSPRSHYERARKRERERERESERARERDKNWNSEKDAGECVRVCKNVIQC